MHPEDSTSDSRRAVLKAFGAAAVTMLAMGSRSRAAADDRLRIGMIGSGNVGSALGGVWAKAGHAVMFSSRNLEHDRTLAARIGSAARAGTPEEAAAFGEVLVFAVPYRALPELGRTLRPHLSGKVVIDTCNPFPHRDGDIAERARAEGAGKVSAELLPGARIVRAFNAVGANRMASAHGDAERKGMPIAGDDAAAIEIASRLIREIGYEPVRVGGLDMGRFLIPGSPLSGERPPDEVRRIAATLR